MSKFKANSQLKSALVNIPKKENIVASKQIPVYNTVNKQGFPAYKLPETIRLISMLNTLKLEDQYYRTESETMKELRDLIETIALKDSYFVAQCIVWSRCCGEGMRSITHLAAALLAPFISGQEWGKRFYSLWNKKEHKGGCIYRPDDMAEIIHVFSALNSTKLTNAMKKGFASALEHLDAYSILKYKKPLYDVINLVHPNSSLSVATVKDESGKEFKALDAIKQDIKVVANTWEVAQSEAGQIVAQAVKEGKLTKEESEEVLKETKAANWNQLLSEGKLGILAALRNIRNILNTGADYDLLSKLLSNGELIRKGKIMPYQIDMAMTIILREFHDSSARTILNALSVGYETAVPNLAEMLPGRNLVIIDLSGSMSCRIRLSVKDISSYWDFDNPLCCAKKACLIGATIAKATNADVITFGNQAVWRTYNPLNNVFSIANNFCNRNMGGTDLSKAWQLASERKYDRVFILSDNECNRGNSYQAYQNYVRSCGDPYVYSIDLAAYGTTAIVGPKVRYYYGYGFSMFEDIANVEFNPESKIEEIRKVII